MTTLSLQNIKEALTELGTAFRVETSSLQQESSQQIASLSTPEHLDKGDFFVLLSEPEKISEEDQSAAAACIKAALDYSDEAPQGVSLEFSYVRLPNEGLIAKTIIRPENLDITKEPIVFAGGLFHGTPVYLEFLSQIAKATGREICAFDSPGNACSSFDERSLSYKMLVDSFPAVIASQYSSDQAVIIAGHSLGTVGARDLFFKQEVKGRSVIENPVTKYIMIAPVPATGEFNQFGGKYVVDGLSGMIRNHGVLDPGNKAQEFYYQQHDDEAYKWLSDRVGDERLAISIPKYVGILGGVNSRSIKKYFNSDKLKYILMSEDNVFPNHRQKRAVKKGAEFIEGADHSAIAGAEVSADMIAQFVQYIEE